MTHDRLVLLVLLVVVGFGVFLATSGEAVRSENDKTKVVEDFESLRELRNRKDRFPVLDNPPMVSAAAIRLDEDEPVIGVVCGGESRAYPISVMGTHELGNDVCGGTHITVSW